MKLRVRTTHKISILTAPLLLVSVTAFAQTLTTQQLLSNHINQRFGMFIHYNMNTYHSGWGENRVSPTTFAPPNGDCHTFTDQWAKAAKSAGMKFGLLTTKHHDGFAIWPSKATPPTSSPYGAVPYTIAQSAVPTMDVVKCYVDSFRAQGLDPNLYFSIWDPNNGIGSQSGHNTDPGPVDWNVVGNFITTQITELLTNYGNIPLFVFDGYSWLTGNQQVPYQKLRALIRQLQPNTIVMDHNGGVPWAVDMEYFEEPLGVKVPAGNITAGAQGQTVANDGDWFWNSSQASRGYLSASAIANEIKTTEPNYANFILDCPPNTQGLLDSGIVTVLGQVPQYWTPNASRAALPAPMPRVEVPLTAVSATATSGNAALAVDGYNDSTKGVNNTMHGTGQGESLWISSGALPQSVTINLGKSYENIDILEYLPQRHTGTTAGNITSYKIFISTNNVTYTQVASGTWPADPTYHGLLSPQRAQFTAQTAQYVRLEADAVSGGVTSAIIGEIAVGSHDATGAAGSGGTGGSANSGGASGSGGQGGTKATGGAISAGGTKSTGGSTAVGGALSVGGAIATGGASGATGGVGVSSGGNLSGGNGSTGGVAASGGVRTTGGTQATRSSSDTGGGATGGASSNSTAIGTGGAIVAASGGSSGNSGRASAGGLEGNSTSASGTGPDSGCGCEIIGIRRVNGAADIMLIAGSLWMAARRRRRV